MKNKQSLLGLILILMCSFGTVQAQSLETFEEKVTEFTLENGLHFIIIERPVAPVASFVTFANVGGVDEPIGNSGISHIFEHMVFKGTKTIGTTDYEKEFEAIQKQDEYYQKWLTESYKTSPDPDKLDEYMSKFEAYKAEAKQYVLSNEFTQIIEQNGGSGLNAFTSSDATGYFYSLPENRAELWFSLESDRFRNPVFREFYEEKDVIYEERRMRTDSNPFGRLLEEFVAVAYSAHPYGNPVVGWPSDIEATTIADTERFFRTFYSPSNLTIAIAGDVDPGEMRALAETYFGSIPKGPEPPKLYVKEPQQRGERRFIIREESQPVFIAGYHTVGMDHEDYAPLQLLGSIISSGRTSRLYRRMVEEEQTALAVQAVNGFPGERYPSLFVTFAIPNQGVSLEEIETAIEEEIQKVKDGDITQEELDRVLTNARANQIRGLNSNFGLALGFAQTHAQTGSWKNAFNNIKKLEAVTLDDLQRVARTYMVKKNRTVGLVVNEDASVAEAE